MRAHFPGRHAGPGILVLGHLDTVHPVGTIEDRLRLRREGVPIHGLDWKEEPEKGDMVLTQQGDPYIRVGNDASGGVSGCEQGLS